MYLMVKREGVVRIPPERLGEDLDNVIAELTRSTFECKTDDSNSFVVLVQNIVPVGEARIVHGDGAVYQMVKYDALLFRPELHEVVNGVVCDVIKFGAFVRIGPLDALLHISQIMDDRIDVDLAGKRLVGKESKRDLKVDDKVRARIVAVSIARRIPRESRIGLTMRQPMLGKFDWLKELKKKEGEIAREERKKAQK